MKKYVVFFRDLLRIRTFFKQKLSKTKYLQLLEITTKNRFLTLNCTKLTRSGLHFSVRDAWFSVEKCRQAIFCEFLLLFFVLHELWVFADWHYCTESQMWQLHVRVQKVFAYKRKKLNVPGTGPSITTRLEKCVKVNFHEVFLLSRKKITKKDKETKLL